MKIFQGEMYEGKLLHSPSIVIGRVQAQTPIKIPGDKSRY